MRHARVAQAAMPLVLMGIFASRGFTTPITADQVVNYSPGTILNSYWGAPYTDASAALGLPNLTQNLAGQTDSSGNPVIYADSSVITPFNASYNPANVVAISNGGTLTLHLSNPIVIGPGAALGIHAAAGLQDAMLGTGQNSDPAKTYTDPRQADVSISRDGVSWTDLGDQVLNNPTNLYSDEPDPFGAKPGAALADFAKPFYGTLSSFDGKDWPGTLAVLDGSAGGTWFDLSSVPLSEANYVRLTTAAGETTYVDAVVGDSAVPEPALGMMICAIAGILLGRRRKGPPRRHGDHGGALVAGRR